MYRGSRTLAAGLFVVLVFMLACTLIDASSARAQTPPSPIPPQPPSTTSEPAIGLNRADASRAKGVPRLESKLLQVSRAARHLPLPAAEAAERAITRVGDRVRVEIDTMDAAAVRATLGSLGAIVEGEYRGVLQALVPASALESLATAGGVGYVRPPHIPYPEAVVAFGAGFTGAHSIFLVAVDATGRATYWDNRGSITIT